MIPGVHLQRTLYRHPTSMGARSAPWWFLAKPFDFLFLFAGSERLAGRDHGERLKPESCRKLQYPWQSVGADLLKGRKIPGARIGHEIAGLVECHAIATGGAYGVVLKLVDTVSILYVVVGVVE